MICKFFLLIVGAKSCWKSWQLCFFPLLVGDLPFILLAALQCKVRIYHRHFNVVGWIFWTRKFGGLLRRSLSRSQVDACLDLSSLGWLGRINITFTRRYFLRKSDIEHIKIFRHLSTLDTYDTALLWRKRIYKFFIKFVLIYWLLTSLAIFSRNFCHL